MGDIELHVTQATAIIYNVCGGTIFAAVLTGLAGQFFRKSFLWFLVRKLWNNKYKSFTKDIHAFVVVALFCF